MKHKKTKKKLSGFLYLAAGLIIFWLAVGIFLLFNKTPASIYVFPENPKQGDTVFLRVKSAANNITGNFGEEKLFFYKRNSNEWVSFLGIDADQKPGDYKIILNVHGEKEITKNIKVTIADFSSMPAALAPSVAQSGITQEKAIQNIRKSDNPTLNKILSNFTAQPYFTAPFSSPLSKMEKAGFSFGKFINIANNKIQHLGVDLRAPERTQIYAVNDGKVVLTANLSNYGKTVVVDHGLNIFSLYLHLDEFKVSDGEIIRRGQLIGLSGDTGYVTAPHLHFSIRVDGTRVDPIAFIETTKKMDNNFILADINNAVSNVINPSK